MCLLSAKYTFSVSTCFVYITALTEQENKSAMVAPRGALLLTGAVKI